MGWVEKPMYSLANSHQGITEYGCDLISYHRGDESEREIGDGVDGGGVHVGSNRKSIIMNASSDEIRDRGGGF